MAGRAVIRSLGEAGCLGTFAELGAAARDRARQVFIDGTSIFPPRGGGARRQSCLYQCGRGVLPDRVSVWRAGTIVTVHGVAGYGGSRNDTFIGEQHRRHAVAAGQTGSGGGAEIRRRSQDAARRQPGQHVDPRGIDDRRRGADDGGVQQPRACSISTSRRTGSIRSCPIWPTSWSWNEDGTTLTFKLRQGVKWHDGKPFTADDVKCTWDLLPGKVGGEAPRQPAQILVPQPRLRSRPTAISRSSFHLKRPQPSFIGLLASGWSPVYPCHVPPAQMRQHPIGTGPFKFVEFKPNEWIKLTRNPDYWKPGRPYLDGIEYTIIRNAVDLDPGARRQASSTAPDRASCRRRC